MPILRLCTLLFALRIALGALSEWQQWPLNWYSGLIPFAPLLALQLGLLLWMLHPPTLAPSWQPWVRTLALIYFLLMLGRLAVALVLNHGFWIPLPSAFHLILATWLYQWASLETQP